MAMPQHLINEAVRAAVIVLVAVGFLRFTAHLFRRMEDGKGATQRRRTVFRLLNSVVRYAADFIVVIMVLEQFQIRTTSLLAGAGILGLAISFGAQGLVQDVVTGIFLLYEDQFGVGDQVNFPALSLSGTVQEVGIRITLLTGLSGETVIIPNRLILEVKNLSRGSITVTVNVPVAPGQNPDKVRAALQEALSCAASKDIHPSLEGITAFDPGTVTWTILAPATLATECAVDHRIRECVAQSFYRQGLNLAEYGKGQSADATSSVSIR